MLANEITGLCRGGPAGVEESGTGQNLLQVVWQSRTSSAIRCQCRSNLFNHVEQLLLRRTIAAPRDILC